MSTNNCFSKLCQYVTVSRNQLTAPIFILIKVLELLIELQKYIPN